MLRKAIVFMITSGLAAKLFRAYRGRHTTTAASPAPRHVSRSRRQPLRSV